MDLNYHTKNCLFLSCQIGFLWNVDLNVDLGFNLLYDAEILERNKTTTKINNLKYIYYQITYLVLHYL